jgi:acetoacetyl-CoA synthetase
MDNSTLWTPDPGYAAATPMAAFQRRFGERLGRSLASYDELWRASVEHRDAFWDLVWDFCGVLGEKGERRLVDGDKMPGACWFPDARLNYAQNVLARRDGEADEAIVFWGETGLIRRMTRDELRAAVSSFAQALRAAGVGVGDRVAGYIPNMPEAIIAMLAASSLGATWTGASPDFGVRGVLDRFSQTTPKVLVCVDGYRYNGKAIDCLAKDAEAVAQLPSLERTVVIPFISPRPDVSKIRGGVLWHDFVAPFTAAAGELQFEQLPFDHPLFIMYSSGTTGVPKCIVHGQGGSLLQHLKEHQLHGDVRPGDRLFYFTTCGWMMWNWLATGLASGAALLLFDGSPFAGPGTVLFDLADAEGMTHFGTSAKYLDTAAKQDLHPMTTHRLERVRAIFSTGSPLAPESFDYVYEKVKRDVLLASISGGTDILSCFMLGSPTLPVRRGEIQCRGLGMAVEVFDDEGRSVQGEKGELVCTRPFPSMPVGFWNDPDGEKYRLAYFDRYPGIWHHGDYVELTASGGMVIYGRSDATLNPGGVRIGTAEIYRQVEQIEEVMESLVIGQDWENDVRVVLFVKLREGLALDEALADKIKKRIRQNTTPRHVPARVIQVTDIPRTKSGKIVELAVRNMVHGRPVKNVEALANPEALEQYRERKELGS